MGKDMVWVLLDQIYIFLTAYAMGFAFCKAVQHWLGYRMRGTDSILFAGIVAAAVYAQSISLVYKVGFLANLIMVLMSLFVYVKWRGEIWQRLKDMMSGSSAVRRILFVALAAAWAYCTSRGPMHYDSDLYHAQSIRWIEEYGIVKGLGNIHVRFAYNSSFFALSALYSMRSLAGQSLHAVNGLIALMLSMEAVRIGDILRRKSVLLSDFARIAALYYLTVIYQEIIAPASDYAVMCTVFFIVIKWLSQLEEDRDCPMPFALLCLGGAFAVSLKLTAGFILLLAVKPARMLTGKKRWKEILICLLIGVLILLPWMARTVLLSGYLLYPFPSLDVFDVDWKIPPQAAALDAAEIRTWGRGLYDARLVDMSILEWFPGWFGMLPATGKLLVLLDMLGLICLACAVIVMLANRKKRKTAASGIYGDRLLVLISVAASYLFWQLSAPLLRYGYAYVLLMAVLPFGLIGVCAMERSPSIAHRGYQVAVAAIVVFLQLKSASLAAYVHSMADQPYYLHQGDYGSYALEQYEVGGVTFYHPKSGDRTGYDPFPSLPRRVEILFRGERIEDGFRAAGTGSGKSD